MDDYDSQAKLDYPVRQEYPSKQPGVQAHVDNDFKRRKEQNQTNSGNACLLFVGVLVCAILIATTSIGAVYIRHIEEHLLLGEQRLKVLEMKSCDCAMVRVVCRIYVRKKMNF